MKKSALWASVAKQKVSLVEREGPGWTVSLVDQGDADCPICGTRSSSRHGSYIRSLQDLPAQGTPVLIEARVTRWRCLNGQCERRTFAGRRPDLTAPFARRTTRMAGIVRLFGHAAGGRPSERLLARRSMPVGHTTILRHVKRGARGGPATLRVAGIDDWAWKKGTPYGTMIVDLERRQVVDVLADRSAGSTAAWLRLHPEVEMVSRDRAGLYADGARQGAPQARQIADRFHLLQNFREAVERQLSGLGPPIRRGPPSITKDDVDPMMALTRDQFCVSEAEQQILSRRGRDADRQALFDRIRALYDAEVTIKDIAQELGLGLRRVQRWVRLIELPAGNVMAPKSCTPAYHGVYLARRWAEGVTAVKVLWAEITRRGYTGSHSHLARFLAPWRRAIPAITTMPASAFSPPETEAVIPPRVATLDPMTGRRISSLTAAALCVKPRGEMTPRQKVTVDVLKAASAEFTAMRGLAMRFAGLLRGGDIEKLDVWLRDARHCGLHAMRTFVGKLRQDIDAVRNAILEPWSNGQVEGQINRLKTLKRAMYGRASVELLRARMMPLQD
ncbi:MAG TPA: ISL3 family transposase [Rhodopila sp.]